MAQYRTLDDLDPRGKIVILRADLNVPLKDGAVADETRIVRLKPTIEELARKGARVVLLSHFGRPKGRADPAFSLRPVLSSLERLLAPRKVLFAEECIGEKARRIVKALEPGEVALLENLRFHPEEEENSPEFARKLAELGDLYVNDAFSASHRAHASIATLPHLLPARAGRLMEAELRALEGALEAPERPLLALIGGAKVSTKLDLLANLIGKVDVLVVAGAMANTFLFAEGGDVGRSLCEREMAPSAKRILALAHARGRALLLPEDAVVAAALSPSAAASTVAIDRVPPDAMILDIGPKTVERIVCALAEARTLVWNGPLGAFETPPFDRGTAAVAREVARLTQAGRLKSIAGGGDTVAALDREKLEGDLSYVSTAGGAFLEWLEGRELPGVKALEPVDRKD
jgi:phosphoglycerate kinase